MLENHIVALVYLLDTPGVLRKEIGAPLTYQYSLYKDKLPSLSRGPAGVRVSIVASLVDFTSPLPLHPTNIEGYDYDELYYWP